jgi:hypothetical protein
MHLSVLSQFMDGEFLTQVRAHVCSLSHTISGAPNKSIRSTCLPSSDNETLTARRREVYDAVDERHRIATANLIGTRHGIPARALDGAGGLGFGGGIDARVRYFEHAAAVVRRGAKRHLSASRGKRIALSEDSQGFA